MAEFPKAILTDAGKNMIARAQMGEKLIFTKGKYGEGQLIASDNVEALTDLKSSKLSLPIQEMSNPQNGQTTITLLIDRANLQGGFWGRELGLFAKIEEGGTEKLFCYTNAGSQADYIAKTDSVVSELIDIDTIVGNVDVLEVVIDKTKVYVTKEKLEEHENDPEAHGDIWKNLPSGVPVGTIIAYAGETAPTGFLECNGAVLKRAAFPGLFQAIGILWGSTASDDFKLPDTYEAARFLRGRSDSLKVGTTQEDAIRDIEGDLFLWKGVEGATGGGSFQVSTTSVASSGHVASSIPTGQTTINFKASSVVPTAEENRPKSAVVMYCIKYADEVTNKEQVEMSSIVQDLANRVRYEDFTQNISENGWSKLPNGIILQWGKFTSLGYGTQITFPMEFPTLCLFSIAVSTSDSLVSQQPNYVGSANTKSQATFCTYNRDDVTIKPYRYIAIGY